MAAGEEGIPRPPRSVEAWLEGRLAGSGGRFVLGDLREEYARVARGSSRLRARLWYLGQALRVGLGRAARPLRRSSSTSGHPRPGPVEMLMSVLQDLRYGFRSLVKTPLFTLTALATLALGIGANAAIFSLVEGVLLSSLPYPESERLVRVYAAYPERDIRRGTLSEPDFRDWRDQSETLSHLTAFPNISLSGFVLTGGDRPDRVRANYVAEGFFDTLGVPALVGRTFTRQEHEEGANRVVVLAHSAWQSRFGGDPDVVGSTLSLSDTPFEVVGVMPPGVEYPSEEAEIWVPLSVIPESGIPRMRFVRFLGAVGRLAPGATVEEAETELTTIARRLAAEYPDSNGQLTAAAVVPLHEQITGGARASLLALLGAVGAVLLICCANVANLMLVRAQGRGAELAVRAALGAGRWRLARQLVTESVLLAVLGGGIGLGLALVAVRSLIATAPADIPRLDEVGVDPSVVLFALAVSLVTGVLFGLAPALRAWRGELQGELKLARGSGSETAGRSRTRGLLVVAEVAVVVVLVIGAGLLLRSLNELLAVEPGFETRGAVAMSVTAPTYKLGPDPDISGFYNDVLDRVRRLPGVLAAGVVRPMPLTPDTFQGEDVSFTVVGEPVPPEGQEPEAVMRFASGELFRAMGIPLLAGRDFDDRDTVEAGIPRGIVNASLARRHFPAGDAVGRRIAAVGGELEIIGVVGDVRQRSLDEEVRNVVYVPITQTSRVGMTLVVRTEGEPTALLGNINRAIWEVNPDQPIENVITLEDLVSRSVAEQRFSALLVGLFAALALVLAAVGIYGVVANGVTQRVREIGIRMALGARADDVVRSVVIGGMKWVAVGIVLGLGTALLGSRLIASLLYGVDATDVPTYVAAALILGLVALLASLLPARRAVRVDPVESLRVE